MGPSNIDLSHKKTLSLAIVINFYFKKKKKEEAKTKLENNAKHEMDWVEKMNTRFEKQKKKFRK